VRYLEKKGLYEATPPKRRNTPPSATKELRVRRNGEVILAGGAFNTPQLLMLSGIGDATHLSDMGIKLVCDLPGVGRNLQDRYEVGIVSELPQTERFKGFRVLEGSRFLAPGDEERPAVGIWPDNGEDRALKEWMNHRGLYATNGAVLTIIKQSQVARQAKDEKDRVPDLFIFGLPGNFRGYKTGYSFETERELKDGRWVENHRRFTWAILKGRTQNQGEKAGYVRLRKKDPLLCPEINFHYFEDGSDEWKKDLDALVEAVYFTRALMQDEKGNSPIIWPEPAVLGNEEALRTFIQKEAWGHHACGTCKIGKDGDKWAVLDKDFRVRGVKNLRVVDASVFPRIPGFFIVTSIYMISEKASKVILKAREDADNGKPQPWPEPGGR
jgi:choline dehydrogenase